MKKNHKLDSGPQSDCDKAHENFKDSAAMVLYKIHATRLNPYNAVKFLLPGLIVLCLIVYCVYSFFYTEGNTTEARTLSSNKGSGKQETLTRENPAQPQVWNEEFLKLLAESQDPKAAWHPVLKKCPMYQEFRELNFLHPALRNRLCRNAEAYKLYPDGYSMCNLQNPFNQSMLDIVRQGSDIVPLLDMPNRRMQMFVYKGPDLISNTIRQSGAWEPKLVNMTLGFALKLPNVTFLDIGSNIGVYSIQAAKLGLPVVSLDANIRNLLRLRLSLDAASLDANLVWNFITSDDKLKYLSFLVSCNVGGAGRDIADLPDTIPVMPMRSERISNLINTRNVVIKMDIQGGEVDFLGTSGRLFTDFNVAAVQMEWSPTFIHGKDSVVMTKFFTDRGYNVWRVPDFTQLDVNNTKTWGEMDIVWLHQNFLKMMRRL